MAIAALATGCERGFVYIRGEYPLAPRAARSGHRAVPQSRSPGDGSRSTSSSGSARAPTSAARRPRSSHSIEGDRGEPRNKPPFPVEAGLFGKPTVVNNVETLVNVLDIVLEGGAAFAATAPRVTARLFCVSGHVARPGLYEVAVRDDARAS